MKTIENYRADMLTILGDAGGRRYSPSMLDMGLREALRVYKSFCPRKETMTVTVKEVEGNSLLIPALPPDVEVQTARIAGGEWLEFATYQTGQWLYINLYGYPVMPEAGTKLTLTLGCPHTIKGLDDAQQTSVPDAHAVTLAEGAAGYAMRIRARSVTEVFGKRPEDRAALMDQADQMVTGFFAGLATLQPAVHDPAPRGNFPI